MNETRKHEIPSFDFDEAYRMATILDHGLRGLYDVHTTSILPAERLREDLFAFWELASDFADLLAAQSCLKPPAGGAA